ncbi:hypothetical protein [Sinomonas humi]|uniref:Uncharacterized protein n=1 Tax=Sinomonas humi TaxID=1338436 RepID=A0A0B2AEJ3_9MICC|nr:hypothetical protein [Sinomonas humi]KHL01959.1 hypothetical protein LK10_13900 [Sinomonas humi]
MPNYDLFLTVDDTNEPVFVAQLQADDEWGAATLAEDTISRYRREHLGEVLKRAELRRSDNGLRVLGWPFKEDR